MVSASICNASCRSVSELLCIYSSDYSTLDFFFFLKNYELYDHLNLLTITGDTHDFADTSMSKGRELVRCTSAMRSDDQRLEESITDVLNRKMMQC